MIRKGYDSFPPTPETTQEPYGGCGSPTTRAVDSPRDNLWTSRRDGVCEAVHTLWIPLGNSEVGRPEQPKLFPQGVWRRNSHRRVAVVPGTVGDVTVWEAERRYGGEDPEAERYPEWIPRPASPRDRFTGRVRMPSPSMAPPVSPAIPPRPTVRQPPVPPPRPRSRNANRYDGPVTRHTDEDLPSERHYLATFGWTTAWYTVPVAIYSAWSLTFPAEPGTACSHPTGGACQSPRTLALANLVHGIPRVGVALGIALLVAGLIRLGSAAWRPVTVGFSSAIVGAGLATVLYSVLTSTG